MKGRGNERLEKLLNEYEKDLNREFVGNKADFYFGKWGKMRKNSSAMKIYSWNWAAVLFGPVWYAYRKMYSFSILYYGLIVGASVALYFFEKDVPSSAFGGGLLVFGLMGNYTYLDFISKKTRKIDEDSTKDEMEKLEECKKQGRTDVRAAVLAGIPIVIGGILEIVR